MSPLASLTNLTKLNLYNNQVADVSPLAPLTKLTTLYLYNNPIAKTHPSVVALRERGVDVFF
eukprot:SAG31_NODE_14666_length_793_cov_1.768012_2_plen_62_part_00